MADDASEYARLYGVTNEPFLGDKKSGLTPTENVTRPYISQELAYLDRILRYQRRYLDGFVTRELDEANAIIDYGITKSDLHTIHPILQRDRWETELPRHLAFYPVVAPGKTGFWVASNDDVWAVWDTLIFGDREDVNPDPVPQSAGGNLRLMRVRPRAPAIASASRQAADERRNEVARNVTFGISSEYCGPRNGLPRDQGRVTLAATLRDWLGIKGQYMVQLSYEELSLLMSDDFTEEERLMQQLSVAKQIVHELAHALGYGLFTDSGFEPYFADEPLIELGNSLVNSILGGNNILEVTRPRKAWWHLRGIHPLALNIKMGWPTFSNVWTRSTPYKPCLDPKITETGAEEYSYALPIGWVADIQKEDYWDQKVAVYGPSALEPHPLTLGSRRVLKDNNGREVLLYLTLNRDWSGPYGSESGPFTEVEKHARVSRIGSAQAIIDALTSGKRESYNIAKATTEDKNKHTTNPDPDVDYSTTFRNAEKEGYIIPPGQGERPETFSRILEVLLQNRQQLALDTMTEWIPANLFLAYINRLDQYQIPVAEYYEFLTSCQAFEAYFEYERRGHGTVRKRDGPVWPTINPVKVAFPPLADQDRLAWHLYRYRFDIHASGKQQLHDVDRDFMFNLMLRKGLRIDRAYWDQAMAYFNYIGGYYTYGPKDIYRRNPNIQPQEPGPLDNPPAPPKGPRGKKRGRDDDEGGTKEARKGVNKMNLGGKIGDMTGGKKVG